MGAQRKPSTSLKHNMETEQLNTGCDGEAQTHSLFTHACHTEG